MPFRRLHIMKQVVLYALDLVQSRKLYMLPYTSICLCLYYHTLYIYCCHTYLNMYVRG